MTRIANPRAREIYYDGTIFAADESGSPEEAATSFREGMESDFKNGLSRRAPPEIGEIITMRDADQNFNTGEWYDVIVS